MAITHVEIKDLLAFRGEFSIEACQGINVLIGGNGTGKTTLLKAMYRMCGNGNNKSTREYFFVTAEEEFTIRLPFEYIRMQTEKAGVTARICVNAARSSGTLEGMGDYIYRDGAINHPYEPGDYVDEYTKSKISYGSDPEIVFVTDNYKSLPAVYIPSTNLLPQAKGLLEMIDDYVMDFDATHVDILKNAQRPITRSLKPNCGKVIKKLGDIIAGEVVCNDGRFYIKKYSGETLQFSIEASGIVRLGLLWKLLRNGLLESGTVFFWDEPENSLNPEYIPILADVLLELSHNGVQIFLATHDYNLARYLDVRKDKNIPVVFHNLTKSDKRIICDSAPEYMKLPDNLLEKTSADLFDAVVDAAMEVNGIE